MKLNYDLKKGKYLFRYFWKSKNIDSLGQLEVCVYYNGYYQAKLSTNSPIKNISFKDFDILKEV